MRILLFIKNTAEQYIHVSTATTEQALDELMQYVKYKVSNGYDVKIQHEQE